MTKQTVSDKQLQLEDLQANLANTDRELETFSKSLDESKDKLRLLEEQLFLRSEINSIAQANFGLTTTKWLWESLPECVELTKKLSANEFEFKKYELMSFIAQVKKNISSVEQQIESQVEARKKLLSMIEEASK